MNTDTLHKQKQKTAGVPDYLIREEVNGVPFYYKGYRDVLIKKKSIEEIMGSSALQAVILQYLFRLIAKWDSEAKYYIGNNEAVLHISEGKNLSNDLALYPKSKFNQSRITNRYFDIPPELVIEVDVRVEAEQISEMDTVCLKTQAMLDFGVEKVIWIMTASKKVIIATPDTAWLILDWNEDIELVEGTNFNIARYLSDEGIDVP